MPRLVVPQFGREGFRCDGAGSPQPPQLVGTAVIPLGECMQRSLERRHGLPVRLGESLRQPVQEQVDWTRRARSGRRCAGRLRRLRQRRRRRSHGRRRSRLRTRPDRSHAPPRRRAVRTVWRRPAATAGHRFRAVGELDLAPKSLQTRAPKLVERSELRASRAARAPLPARLPRTWPAPRRALARRDARDRVSARPLAPGTPRRPRRPPRPRARSAERSSSPATSSSRPAAACARCQARRSGSASGSVASASA